MKNLKPRKNIPNEYMYKLTELIEVSTMHGLPNAVRSKNWFMRIIWVSFFLAFFVYSFFSVVKMILNFLNFDVVVNVELLQSFDDEFPTVTFCNLNSIDYTIKKNVLIAESIIYNLTNKNQSFLYNNNEKIFLNNSICSSSKISKLIGIQSQLFEQYSLKKMIIKCLFDEKPCKEDEFHITNAPLYGNCYSFNYGRNISGHEIPILKIKEPGLYRGFQLQLFVGAPEYQPCWENRYGALVVIHNRTTLPLFLEEGIIIPAGAETNLGLNKLVVSKLDKPYSDCVSNLFSKDAYDSNSFRETIDLHKVYRQKWCIFDCAKKLTFQRNKIICPDLVAKNLVSSFECHQDLSNLTDFYENCSKECPVECELSFFNKNSFLGKFPTYSYSSYLLSKEEFSSRFPYKNVTYDQMTSSILAFNVYFESNSYQKISEQPATDFETLLGNIGGQLGLFLGVSFLSFVEIIEIFIEILFIFFNNKIKRSQITFFNK